ncbi:MULTISPECIES: hypothetical protein [Hafniaceae]|uniref:hypothetical protein n=1 Tax=Hafniaceae TaxID=1903412 RepID=UPI00061CE706|nr:MULTISPECIES: hypothetical protein [Hafniaceae]KKF38532.1 hypothetical protein PU01_23015 [Hafnia alvei]MBW3478373.1 hypothetical protein [Hafnia alvei]MCE9871052.1 hypothetical protein [Hafnia alvei]MDX6842965.1 hypothetical protein [Hafnia paralvei]PNK70567.1 hypothetical protein A6J69_000195 [Hafnia paralvei]
MKSKFSFKKIDYCKFFVSITAVFFMFSSPANAMTIGEIFQKIADQAQTVKTAAAVIAGVIAFLCMIFAGAIIKRKANGDHEAKLSSVGWLVLAALVFGGATFWLSTVAESTGVEMTSY